MKKNFYSFALASLLMLSANPVLAKDYYLATGGNDANNGETAATALATLNAAVAKLQAGDVLHVSGMIKVNETAAFAHKKGDGITIVGENKDEDGFDGQNAALIINPNDSKVIFKNLTFQNGYNNLEDKNKGGAAIWGEASDFEVDNCMFLNNIANRGFLPGGAIGLLKGNLKVTNSFFSENTARNGGAVYAKGATKVELESNRFVGNIAFVADGQIPTQGDATDGGALWLRDNSENIIRYCEFEGNTAHRAGGAISMDGSNGNTTIEANAFINNWSGGRDEAFTPGGDINDNGRFKRAFAGAIQLHVSAAQKDSKFNFFSNTFAQNNTVSSGGAVNIGGNNANVQLNFVNNTVTDNTTLSTIGAGAGLYLCGDTEGKNFGINIVNCILEGNKSVTNAGQMSDLVLGSTKANIKASVIGNIRKYDDLKDNYTIDEVSKVQTTPGKNNELTVAFGELEDNCFPLPADNTDVTTMGNLVEAKLLGLTVDQKGQEWTKPYIGAVQLVAGDEIPETPTGIEGVATDAAVSNGIVNTYIYNVAGQLVSNAKTVAGLAKGIYVVKTVVGKNVKTRKVYVK